MYTTSEPCEFQQPTVAYMYETKRQLLSLKVSLAHTHNSDRQPIVVILNAKKTSREALKDCNKNNVIHAPYIKPFIYHTCHTLVFFTIYDSSHIQLKPKVFCSNPYEKLCVDTLAGTKAICFDIFLCFSVMNI